MTDDRRLDYFIQRTDRDIEYIRQKIDGNNDAMVLKLEKIDTLLTHKIDELMTWKWISFGVYIAVSAIMGAATSLLMIYVEYKK